MAIIKFSDIPKDEIKNFVKVFDFIADGKRRSNINEEKLAVLLNERYNTKFWWPSEEERESRMRLWEETPLELRSSDTKLKTPWDYGSWVDAILNAKIEFKSINVNNNGGGEIKLEQLSWPSGGIEAAEEIIKIFDGHILSNDAI